MLALFNHVDFIENGTRCIFKRSLMNPVFLLEIIGFSFPVQYPVIMYQSLGIIRDCISLFVRIIVMDVMIVERIYMGLSILHDMLD